MTSNCFAKPNKWIEPQHISFYLQDIYKIKSDIYLLNKQIQNLSNLPSNIKCINMNKENINDIIMNHLYRKKPILIDDGSYSYLIIEYIGYDKYICIDPHKWTAESKSVIIKRIHKDSSYIILCIKGN